MEEEALRPYLEYEAPWEQELRTLERKLAAAETNAEESADAGAEACPCDPAALASMAAGTGGVQDRDELTRVVVAFTDEDNETLMTLPRRQCLFCSFFLFTLQHPFSFHDFQQQTLLTTNTLCCAPLWTYCMGMHLTTGRRWGTRQWSRRGRWRS